MPEAEGYAVTGDDPLCFGSGPSPQAQAENGCNDCPVSVRCFSRRPPISANAEQFGGDHYKTLSIQPWEVIDTWPLAERIGFYRGNALKYTMRLHDKDTPIDNIEKAGHYCRKLAEVLRERVQPPEG